MACDLCAQFPSPTSPVQQLSVSQKKQGTLFCCLECGQILEQIKGNRGHTLTSVVETMFDYDFRLPYIHRINCRHCGLALDLIEALRSAPYAWPYLRSFWHTCQECGGGNHVWTGDDEWGLIEIWGAPGPDWSFIQKAKRPGVATSNDRGLRLVVTCDGERYEIEAR